MYDGMRGPIGVSRALVVGLLLATLIVASLCGWLWYRNTSTIHALDAGRSLTAAPGETVRVQLTQGESAGSVITFQRKGLFGRWQQTHRGQERDVIRWFDLGDQSWNATPECVSRFEITVPDDVTWSPVAACSIAMDCFVIDVEQGGKDSE